MSYEDLKIKDSDISTHGVVAAPDRLSGTAQENKAVFDRLIKNVVSQKFNNLLEQVREDIENIEVPPKGEKGDAGMDGADGYTPTKGVDYWTEEDMAEIKGYIDESPRITMELLWKNASTASEFPAQTIPLALEDGEWIAVRISSELYYFKADGTSRALYSMAKPDGYRITMRTFTPTSTGVNVSAGQVLSLGSSSTSQNNYSSVPYQIYRVRGIPT